MPGAAALCATALVSKPYIKIRKLKVSGGCQAPFSSVIMNGVKDKSPVVSRQDFFLETGGMGTALKKYAQEEEK